MNNDHRRSTISVLASFVGESLREMAVLIAVFAPLDALTRAAGLTVWMVLATIVIVAVFFGLGVVLEVKRP